MSNEDDNKAKTTSRHGRRGVAQKPKDFKKGLKNLFISLKKFLPIIIISFILATASSIFAIVGPNKISDLTSEIQKGLIIDIDKFQEISEKILSDLSEDNMKLKSQEIITNTNISNEDKKIFMEKIQTINETNAVDIISSMPETIKNILLPEIEIDGTKITTNEKIEFLNLLKGVNKDSTNAEKYKAVENMPNNIKELVKPKMNMNNVWHIARVLIIIYLLSAIFNFSQSFLMADVSNNYARNLRKAVSEKINRLPLKYFDNHTIGDLLSRMTNDIDTIGTAVYESFGSMIGQITLVIGTIIMMFVTNWIMALSAIGASLIGFAFMFLIMGKSQKYFSMRQTELGKLNGHIEEIYRSLNIVKTYNGEDAENEKFNKYNKSVYTANYKSQFLGSLMGPTMGFIGNLSYVVVCVVGAVLTMNNIIEFGTIVAFMIYIRLFTNPLSQIAQSVTQLQTAIAASERVFEFIDEAEMIKEENKKTLDKSKVKGNIEFEHVKFGYDDSKTIIKDFSCKVKPGEKIAIVGPTGAGKTTLVNLLMKFYEINDGKITIDGVDIKDLTRENIHDLFIMVLQDTWLFNGTVRENIKYNQENITDKQIWNCLKVVGVDHFVKSLPKELDYKIEDNESISAGQKQLLTIARGMVKNAPFLILDEATSSVDTRTEELVQSAMDKLTEGRTSFIIAHRLSTIKNADLILVMNEGNIIEQGNHEELMKQNGFYADLYNSQFKKASREVIE